MSVQTEIDRLQAAKAELKSAIEEKGVTVPDAATLDGYGVLVGQIEQSRDTAAYVTLGLVDSSDGGYVAFLKTREGYQTINLSSQTGNVEVEAGSFAVFALWEDKGYVLVDVDVTSGSYLEAQYAYIDETLFGQRVFSPRVMAFLTDCNINLVANSGHGGGTN